MAARAKGEGFGFGLSERIPHWYGSVAAPGRRIGRRMNVGGLRHGRSARHRLALLALLFGEQPRHFMRQSSE